MIFYTQHGAASEMCTRPSGKRCEMCTQPSGKRRGHTKLSIHVDSLRGSSVELGTIQNILAWHLRIYNTHKLNIRGTRLPTATAHASCESVCACVRWGRSVIGLLLA